MATIRQRSKGTWTIELSLGFDPVTGKRRRHYETFIGKKSDALKHAQSLQVQLDTGSFVIPTKITVESFLGEWLDTYCLTNLRESSMERYQSVIRLHLIPDFGHILLSELRPFHLKDHYARALQSGSRKGGPLKPSTVKKHHMIIKEALGHAVKWGYVARNVADAVDPPRISSEEAPVLDEMGARIILEHAQGTIWHPIFHLALYTGLRRGELLGLRWKDLDLDRNLLSCSQALYRLDSGRTVISEPKTRRGRRTIDLSPNSAIALRAYREKQEAIFNDLNLEVTPDTRVFERPDGTAPSPDSVSHAFAKYSRIAGFEGVRLHTLRHTHASLLMKKGDVGSHVISQRLGHSSPTFTISQYVHVLPGQQRDAAIKFDQIMEE